MKKNQIIITVLAALIILAGYLNYADSNAKEASGNISGNNSGNNSMQTGEPTTPADINSNDADITGEPGEAVIVNGVGSNTVSVEAKLSREQARAANKELLLNLVNNANVSEDERQEVIAQLIELTKTADKEVAAENLLKSKGYENSVVTITNGKVDIIVNETELTDTMRAQIEDVVKRTTEIGVDKITITNISK